MEQHTTTATTTTTSTSGARGSSVEIERQYVTSIPGMLLLGSMVIDIIIAICVGAAEYLHLASRGQFLIFVSVFFLFVSAAFYLLHLFAVKKKLPAPWLLIDVVFLSLNVFFHFVGFCLACDTARQFSFWRAGAGAAAFFLLANIVLIGVLVYLAFRDFKASGFSINVTTEPSATTTATRTDVEVPPANDPATPYSQY